MKPTILVIILAAAGISLFPGENTGLTLDIEGALRMARENNKNYLISREEVNRYKHKLRQNLGFLPNVTLQGTRNLDEKLMEIQMPPVYPGGPPQSFTIDFTKNYEFTFQVVQPLFAGGKILYPYKNARLDLRIAGEKSDNAEKETTLQVKKTFFNILVMKELLKAHREALELAETNYRNINENYNLGMASKYDLLRAELAVASVKPPILNVEKLLELSLMNLKFMTGIPPETELDIVGTLTYDYRPLELAELVDHALTDRSEIRQMRMEMQKVSNLLRIAYGQFLPDISIIASYSYRADFFKLKGNAWEDYYTVNLGISFPIFTQYKRAAQVGELKVMRKILDLNYAQLKEATQLEIRRLVMTMQEEYQNIRAGLKNMETAKEGLRIAELSYAEGLVSILELNASTNDLTKAKVNFFQAVYNYNIAAAELEKITGIKIEGGDR